MKIYSWVPSLISHDEFQIHRSERTNELFILAASNEEPAPTPSSKNMAVAIPCDIQWVSSFNNLVKIKGALERPKGKTVNRKYLVWPSPNSQEKKQQRTFWEWHFNLLNCVHLEMWLGLLHRVVKLRIEFILNLVPFTFEQSWLFLTKSFDFSQLLISSFNAGALNILRRICH